MRFGSYEIGEPIGAGGMGEVYRAHDTTLERDVAIKVLPASFVNDQARIERFEREAKTLASLNHSNIAQIHGLEKSDGTTAIVMELIDGPTLADRIAEGRLPADEALNIALQIADALEAAHGQGIVHRDLKPANVKVRPDGTVKVLDFGIAKAFDLQAASGPAAPALTTPAMTQTGIILGTAAYMSPEQARGKPVDDRTDVWAFGCLLYEMLTGQPAFAGEDVAITLARILANDTDMKSLPAAITPAVRQTIELCLRKDPKKRIADIRDVKLALEGAFDTLTPQGGTKLVERKPAWRRALPSAAALVLGGVLVSIVAWSVRPEMPPPQLNRFAFNLLPDQTFRFLNRPVMALSRDGRSIVYGATEGLYLRRLDALEPQLIPGTQENLASPFISPDGQSVGYMTPESLLKRISISGGAPTAFVNTGAAPLGVTWGVDGFVYYGQQDGIYRVNANGGMPELFIPSSGRADVPVLLPDGDTVLYSFTETGSWADGQVAVQSISTGERKVLVSGGADARYVPTGHLIYAFQDVLFGIAFDLDTLTVSGTGVPLVRGVLRSTAPASSANYAVSDDGTLVYVRGTVASGSRGLVWVDRNGREEVIDVPPRAYTSPRISPDGSRLLVNLRDQEQDIWIWDFARSALTRLTFDPGQDRFPVWSADGQRVVYSSQTAQQGPRNTTALSQAADGTGSIEELAGSDGQIFPTSFLPDGTGFLGFDDTHGNDDLILVTLDGEETVTWLLTTTFAERSPEASPDGRWFAYESDESGTSEVYVRPFPDINDGRWQISTDGGSEPLWSRDGRELFYRAGNAVMAVSIETEPRFAVSSPSVVFEGPYLAGVGVGGRAYDIAADGDRFLMIKPVDDSTAAPQFIIVENWFEELKRLVPTE